MEDSQVIHQVKEGQSQKMTYMSMIYVCVCVYEVSRAGNSVETGSRFVVA